MFTSTNHEILNFRWTHFRLIIVQIKIIWIFYDICTEYTLNNSKKIISSQEVLGKFNSFLTILLAFRKVN